MNNVILVSVPVVKMTTYKITAAEGDLIRNLYRLPGAVSSGCTSKVEAIKFIRDQYGLELKEAKDLCDAVATGVPDVHGDIVGERIVDLSGRVLVAKHL